MRHAIVIHKVLMKMLPFHYIYVQISDPIQCRWIQKESTMMLYREALLRAITFLSFTVATQLRLMLAWKNSSASVVGYTTFILYKSDFTISLSRVNCPRQHYLLNFYVNSPVISYSAMSLCDIMDNRP